MTEDHAELVAVAVAFAFPALIGADPHSTRAERYIACAVMIYIAYRVMTMIMGAA